MTAFIRPKKSLGQHFLIDENIARKIVESLPDDVESILEIGPGTGVLTKYLLSRDNTKLLCIETDEEAVEFLIKKYPDIRNKILHEDFLKSDLHKILQTKTSIIGNFPYNISSQIFFRILEHRENIDVVVCMIQKEVAERIASPPGNKKYGILSVLLQTYFDIKLLFSVNENVFTPPPKVKSAVIRLIRNPEKPSPENTKLYFQIVKSGFNYRRKTLRNALKSLNLDLQKLPQDLLGKRAEQLGVEEFMVLADSSRLMAHG